MKIDIKQLHRKIRQDVIDYTDDAQKYICMIQRIFSLCLFCFFIIHIITVSILYFTNWGSIQTAVWISVLQMLFSLFWYFSFKYYFCSHKKYTLVAAYFNIFQVIMILEIQYCLYDEYISYTVIICIILATSLTMIGHIKTYTCVIMLALLADILLTLSKNYDFISTYQMKMYVLDNIFILIIAVGINFCVSWLKYQDFEKQKQILYLSERDSLTGLLNRNALAYAIQKHIHHQTSCAMILLDLDNFKTLNDTLGHYKGDHCLCAVAKELNCIFEHTGDVCRLGGDEFVIFMSHIPNQDFVIEKANQLLQKIPRKYPHATGDISITCSIGVAFSQGIGDNLYEKLYKFADSAMYQSKAKGKNTITIFSNNDSCTKITED